MNEIQTWDYEASVERVRPKVMKLKSLTLDVYHELWEARKHLSSQGARTDLTSGQMTRSWEGYCEDVGLVKRTVNRWLSGYDPVERKVIAHQPIAESNEPDINDAIDLLETKADMLNEITQEDVQAQRFEKADVPKELMQLVREWIPEATDMKQLVRAHDVALRLGNALSVLNIRFYRAVGKARTEVISGLTKSFSLTEEQAVHIVDTPAERERFMELCERRIEELESEQAV